MGKNNPGVILQQTTGGFFFSPWKNHPIFPIFPWEFVSPNDFLGRGGSWRDSRTLDGRSARANPEVKAPLSRLHEKRRPSQWSPPSPNAWRPRPRRDELFSRLKLWNPIVFLAYEMSWHGIRFDDIKFGAAFQKTFFWNRWQLLQYLLMVLFSQMFG